MKDYLGIDAIKNSFTSVRKGVYAYYLNSISLILE